MSKMDKSLSLCFSGLGKVKNNKSECNTKKKFCKNKAGKNIESDGGACYFRWNGERSPL